MLDASVFDDLSRRLGALLPPGLADAKADFERNARAAVQGALGNLDLVTREEFDVQTAVLARTRARLEELETRLAEVERASSQS
jgi:BMFP domain-containing protein YqiC